MIKEDHVSFEIAKLLKEKGFNEPCYRYYDNKGDICGKYINPDIPFNYSLAPYYLCPSQSIVMKWLREVHYIHITALCPIVDVDTDTFGVKYNVVISNLKNYCLAFDTDIEDNEYDTYEEAIEEALKYTLKNLI